MFEHTLLNEYEAAGLAEDESHKVRYVCRQVRNGRICEHEQQTYKDNPQRSPLGFLQHGHGCQISQLVVLAD